jgi:hypothetical protein
MAAWMRQRQTRAARAFGSVIAVGLVLGACSQPAEPTKITKLDIGATINPDKSISSMSETFSPSSTVYASLKTEGTTPATLTAKWVAADGQVLAEQSQSIAPTGPAYFEFHLSPPGGWPKGRHKATFAIDGTGVRTREFEVR